MWCVEMWLVRYILTGTGIPNYMIHFIRIKLYFIKTEFSLCKNEREDVFCPSLDTCLQQKHKQKWSQGQVEETRE